MNPKTMGRNSFKDQNIIPGSTFERELPWDTLEDHMILLWDFPTFSYQYLVKILFNGGCYDWVSKQFLCFEIFHDILPSFGNHPYHVFQYHRIFIII